MRVRNSRRGGVVLGLLITALVLVCLVVGFGIYVASHIRVVNHDHNGGSDVSIDLPGGHLDVRAHERPGSAVAGVPLYPGARAEDHSGGDAVIQWSSNRDGGDKGFGVSASGMITDDSLDKVVDYYRKQLPNWVVAEKRDGSVSFELRDGGYQRIVAIQERRGHTHIGVATVGEPASN